MNRIQVTGTGQKIEVASKHHATIPAMVEGEHFWIVVVMFKVTPNALRYELDQENLLTIEGPGCYWCEAMWSADVAQRRCPGDASPELARR